MSELTRREWLRRAAVAGLGLGLSSALGGCAFTAERPRYRVIDAGLNHALGHRLRGPIEVRPPERNRRCSVAIVGGGISGLSAAWALRRAGVDDILLLELESEPGGNAAGGANAISPYPWGAHYVPLVNEETHLTRQLFEELGLITGTDARGRAIYDELALVHDPVERLYYRGRWHDGLEPNDLLDRSARRQLDRLERELVEYETRVDARGRRWFAIPTALGSDAPELRALDAMPFTQWLSERGYDAPLLRWYLDYCTRDDYGLRLDQTSAWGGLHYFAARAGEAANADDEAVLTWPEGNAYLVRRLAEPLGERLLTGRLVHRVEPTAEGVSIDVLTARGATERLEARAAVLATPLHVSARLCPALGLSAPALVRSPWVVANVSVEQLPTGVGAAPAWDNVSAHSPSLGYIVATHQQVGRREAPTVLTWYLPLTEGEARAARAEAMSTTAEAWAARAVADLSRMHPGLETQVSEVAVRVWGHGMVGPTPGVRFDARLARLREHPHAQIALAHTDLSGLSIFEEAQQLGVSAAHHALRRLGHRIPTA